MPLPSTYATGTVTVSANGTVVTGAGTQWIAGGIRPGDRFAIKGLSVSIASVNSATSITLAEPWAGGALSGSPYEIRYTPDATRVLAASRAALERFEGADLRKSNFSAARAPMPSDDDTQGYAVGSRWQWQGREWIREAAGWVERTRGEIAAPQLADTSSTGIVALQSVVDRAAEAIDISKSYPQVAAGAVIPAGNYEIPAGQTLILRRGVRLRGTSQASTRITHKGGNVPAMQMDRTQTSNTFVQLEDFELIAGDTAGVPIGIDCFGNVRNGHLRNLTVRGFGTNVFGDMCYAMTFDRCDFQNAADYNVDLLNFTAGLFLGGRNDQAGISNVRLRGLPGQPNVHTVFMGGFYQRSGESGIDLEDVDSAVLQGVYFEGNGRNGGNVADVDWHHGTLARGNHLALAGCFGTATTGSPQLRFVKARTAGRITLTDCNTYIGTAPGQYHTALECGASLKQASLSGCNLGATNRITSGVGTMIVDDWTGRWAAGDQAVNPFWSSRGNFQPRFDAPANRRLEHVLSSEGVNDWFLGRGDADEAFPGDYYISQVSGGGASPPLRVSKATGRTFLRPPGPYADDAAAAAAGVPLQGLYLMPSGALAWRQA